MLFNSVVILALLGIAGVEAATKPVSKNARCGPSFGGTTCQGSKWGNCCSQYSYCGSSKDYCDVAKKCQIEFGTCNGQGTPSSIGRTTMATSIRASSSAPPPSTPTPSSDAPSPPGTCSAVTVTALASPITVTASASAITVTESASAIIVTASAITVTESASAVIVTASAITVTETPSAILITQSAITVTETPSAIIVTASAITVTETPSAIILTQTASAITVTESASVITVTATPSLQPTCSATQAVNNPSFESGTNWIYTSNPAIGSGLIRGSPGSANPAKDGSYIIQSAIDRVLDVNNGHKITSAIRVCKNTQYRFSIWLRNITASAPSRPTLVQVFINGVRVLTSTAVDLTWTEFTGVWSADSATDAATVQIVTYCEAPVTSGTWSYHMGRSCYTDPSVVSI